MTSNMQHAPAAADLVGRIELLEAQVARLLDVVRYQAAVAESVNDPYPTPTSRSAVERDLDGL